ncbi:MAG: ABC transporter ATP-binding protein [Verrucomicrobiota bacterium]
MSDAVITVKGLTKHFGSFTAVKDVSMDIERGQVHGFLGPNGSGKTTTLRMMCGLMVPSAGPVSVLGMSVPEKAATVRRHVGYMTQRFSLYEDMTVLENMQFLCRIHGLKRQRRKERIEAVLGQFELGDLAEKRVGPMSGGQKRRIALGAAVLTEPELLILDEPTSEVDPNTRRDMWRHFFDLAQGGATLLVTTHLMDEAERCHRLTIMSEGNVVADGSVEGLKADLPAKVLQVSGEDVTRLVPGLSEIDGVITVSQVGKTLRVLVISGDVRSRVESALPAGMDLEAVGASIEDVFVDATRKSKRQ